MHHCVCLGVPPIQDLPLSLTCLLDICLRLSSHRKVLGMSDGAICHEMCVTRGLGEISSEVEQWRSEASLWFSSSIHRWSCHLFFISPHNEPGSLMLYVLHQRLTPLPPFRAQAAHLKALGTITVHRAQCPSYCIECCL